MPQHESAPDAPGRLPSVEEMRRLAEKGDIILQLQAWFLEAEQQLPPELAARGIRLFGRFLDSGYTPWHDRAMNTYRKALTRERGESDAYREFAIAAAKESYGFREPERGIIQRLFLNARAKVEKVWGPK